MSAARHDTGLEQLRQKSIESLLPLLRRTCIQARKDGIRMGRAVRDELSQLNLFQRLSITIAYLVI